jgi:hypothetical protein
MPSKAPETRSEEVNPPSPMFIPSILFSRMLRLFLLRCILVAGSIILVYEVWWKFTLGIVMLSVTVLHHLLRYVLFEIPSVSLSLIRSTVLSVFGPQFVPLFGWMDIFMILVELACE